VLIDHQHKLKFRKSTGVRIQNLDIGGYIIPLSDALDLDSTSRVNIETVYSIFDAGMLDDPRVTVGGGHNKTSSLYTDTGTALFGQNLLADPNMTDVGSTSDHDWWVQMGDVFGEIFGSVTVEQTASGPRLKIVQTANPNDRRVRIDLKLNVAPEHFGKQPIARYRVDGPSDTILWGENFVYQYASRVSNSLTAAAVNAPLTAIASLIFVLPPTLGTFYISKVGIVANS
jgi:hypothetical protein